MDGISNSKAFSSIIFLPSVGKVSKFSKNRSDPTFAKGPTHLGILWGLYVINHDKDPVIKQPGFSMESIRPFLFFLWPTVKSLEICWVGWEAYVAAVHLEVGLLENAVRWTPPSSLRNDRLENPPKNSIGNTSTHSWWIFQPVMLVL